MGYISTPASIAFVALIALMGAWANDPTVEPAGRHVLTTAVYSLGGAVALNSVCALLATQFSLVEPVGSESVACLPYSIVSAPITARIHMFSTGGYGNGEWGYLWSAPSRTTRLVEDTVCKALGRC